MVTLSDKLGPSDRSSHANHPGSSPSVQEKITPHIPQQNFGHPFFNFPPYFFKVAILRFNTVLDTNGTLRHCWSSLRALKMLPIDSPSNFTLDGMFAPHFRKRSLAKIQKIPKKLFGRYRWASREKNRDLNRISLTLSKKWSLISGFLSSHVISCPGPFIAFSALFGWYTTFRWFVTHRLDTTVCPPPTPVISFLNFRIIGPLELS